MLLAGLAIGGKGFAYLGLPPLFITELMLLLGVGVFLLQRRWRETLGQPTAVLLVLSIAWSLAQTLPYLGTHGLDAPRDMVLVGYGIAALIVAAVVISDPSRLAWLLGRYQRFALWFLALSPLLWVAYTLLNEAMPTWPWAPGVGIVELKPGDTAVHLGAIAAAAILGLFRGRSIGWIVLLALLLAALAAVSRGALVAFASAAMVGLMFRPRSRWAWRLLGVGLTLVLIALLVDVRMQVPGRQREFSARQLTLNFVSILGDNETGDLDDTKTWRLQWWEKIARYTFAGPHFWTGKGYGVNLANDDGFQVYEDDSLRSPHNGHLNVLARTGVPGLTLWVAVQAAWLAQVMLAYLDARRRGHAAWCSVFGLLLAYWTAMTLNASVDVYLEGPMGGVWFWTIVGLGLAATWIHRHAPEVLQEADARPIEPWQRHPTPS